MPDLQELLRRTGEVKALAEKITPGPWVYEDEAIMSEGLGSHVAQITTPDDFPCLEPEDLEDCRINCAANAELIAKLPDLCALIASLASIAQQQEKELERLRKPPNSEFSIPPDSIDGW